MDVYLPIANLSVNVLVIVALGALTGLLSGMFGVGGGFLTTPLLIFYGVPPTVAAASAATQVTGASVSGVFFHRQRGGVDVLMGGVLVVGGVIGTGVGALLFRGPQDFFFKVKPNALIARQSVAWLSGRPRRPRSSSTVSSGASRTARAIAAACPAHFGGAPWRWTLGAIEPVSRRRCLRRRTQEALTRYLAATSSVAMPASQSARTRSRRSSE